MVRSIQKGQKFKFPTPKQQKKTRQKIEKKHPKTPPTTTRFLLKGQTWGSGIYFYLFIMFSLSPLSLSPPLSLSVTRESTACREEKKQNIYGTIISEV
jgi:hypothetical protein